MGSNYRDSGRESRRERGSDWGREQGRYEFGRDRYGDGRRERSLERGSSSHGVQREAPQRFTPVCYECGEPGHYRNQCPKLGRDGGHRPGGQRGRSTSPRQFTRQPEPRAMTEDPAMTRKLEDLAASMAAMKEVIEAENAAKEEKRKRKTEKLERKRLKEEEAWLAEEARLAEQKRLARKEEKLRKEEEARENMRKELLMEISIRMGQLDESLQQRYERDLREKMKGKQQVVEYSSDEESVDSHGSDVDALSRKTEQLVISEKRKWGADLPIDDSPPMETPAKRVAKRRLQLGCRHQPLKKSPPYKTPLTSRKKIPAAPGSVGKLRFITDNLRQLGNMNVDELKRICIAEGVEYEGKKMQAILALAEKRTVVAYGEEEGRVGEENAGEIRKGGEEEEPDAARFPYPRIGGHMQFRLQELEGIHPLLCNANNVLKLSHPDRGGLLLQEIKQGLEGWVNWRGGKVTIGRAEVEACLSVKEDTVSKYLDMGTVCRLKKQLEGLVLTPLDRNPGETLALCPRKYYEAMLQLFVTSVGYRVIREPEAVVMEAMRCEVFDAGLTKLAQWDKKGKFGEAYVMPKHKDLTRFRPICPTYSEPTVRGCRIVAKALNHLLFSLPQDWHFNLRSNTSFFEVWDPVEEVFGICLMDDVSLIVLKRRRSSMKVERIRELFEVRYPENLQLKRTDDDSGSWDFLGTQMHVNALQPFVTCCQVAKNERTIWQGDALEFKNGQSFRSWGCKQQKGAVITCHLHRIDRNTNDRTCIPRQVLSLVRELRLKDFPAKTVERTLKRFAKGRDWIWNWTVLWLNPP
ncbi:hypothetical protein CBR_g37045 [Chara braunii]|uniref:CCHC-type domain-containing protein n=1 Tax=Chara braunii TaxID=69332 RepID=A0A388LM91_CHABU|nr:hypothetical protein CBR_g37045 [Chara braunii]|eukprot:GBG83332.1 hypothetical protein CBR_g37045 [Chara braunii]